jgi:hypothetical protein
VDSDAPDPVAHHLDFAGVNTGPDFDSERLHAPDRGGRTPGLRGRVAFEEVTAGARVVRGSAKLRL